MAGLDPFSSVSFIRLLIVYGNVGHILMYWELGKSWEFPGTVNGLTQITGFFVNLTKSAKWSNLNPALSYVDSLFKSYLLSKTQM